MKKYKLKKMSKKNEIRINKNELQQLNCNKDTIIFKMEQLKSKELIISEHAILRYIERVLEINIEKIKSEILTDEIIERNKILGSGKYKNNKKFEVVIKDNIVVTIETKDK
jgi:ribosomal protein L15